MKEYLRILVVLSTFLLAAATVASAGRTIYVDAEVGAGGDGSSCATAFKYLQDALAVADANDEIRVAQGTYIPDRSSVNPGGSGDRLATFQLISGVAIYGGYAGSGETDPNERDTKIYETILSGDLNGDDGPNFANNNENSYNVTTGSGTDATAVLDSLTITAGNANGSSRPNDACGGGMILLFGSPTVLSCIFSGNSAEGTGGGMSSMGLCNITLTNCTFSNNFAASGGGMAVYEAGNPKLTNCTFAGNVASQHGGGFCIMLYPGFASTFDNCIFSGNQAGNDGGAYYTTHDSPAFTNCTFTGNSAGQNGGASCFLGNTQLPRFTNCIIWDNTAGNEGPQIAIKSANAVSVNYCDVQGDWWDVWDPYERLNWGANNIDVDPCFVDAENGDYHLQWDSPCINAGDPSFVFDANERDIDGEPRVMAGCVDIGADETSEKQADFTRNGKIDTEDLGVFVQSWLSSSDDIDWYILCDLYEDDGIDFADFAEFANDWLWRADWYEP